MSVEQKHMILTDPDYIASKRFAYSLVNLLIRYPEGCSNRIIAAVLMMDEEAVELMYAQIVGKLQKLMKVDPL